MTGPIAAPRLCGILHFAFKLETVTGLLIRMPVQAQTAHIGGADMYPMVARRVYRLGGEELELEVPYIPGSSLKGRMRSLLELALGKRLYTTDMKIWLHVRNIDLPGGKKVLMSPEEYENDVRERCEIDDLFGGMSVHFEKLVEIYKSYNKARGKQVEEEEAKRWAAGIFSVLAPTRLLVDDLFPDEGYVENLYKLRGEMLNISDFLEDKSENRIDRVTSAADPRDVVRVRPGVVFSGRIRMLVFAHDCDVLHRYLSTVVRGLRLVEDTYLGAGGSRGYGRVRFRDISVALRRASDAKLEGIGRYGSLDELEEKLEKLTENVKERLSGCLSCSSGSQ